nr:Rrf2 family transcriptional regulator [Lacrimispora algidixylanolytica]
MIEEEQEAMLSAQILAEHLQVSATYLSKKLPQLVKAGLVQSVTGANGELCIKKAS